MRPQNASVHSSPTTEMHWTLREKVDDYFSANSTTQICILFAAVGKGKGNCSEDFQVGRVE